MDDYKEYTYHGVRGLRYKISSLLRAGKEAVVVLVTSRPFDNSSDAVYLHANLIIIEGREKNSSNSKSLIYLICNY